MTDMLLQESAQIYLTYVILKSYSSIVILAFTFTS